MREIPFNQPHTVGRELDYIRQAIENHHLSGDGPFTRRCQDSLESLFVPSRALLTHSCTAALEMAAILAGIAPGDEVIMPSFTFVSTANAFVLRGGVPVFVDVRPDTLNLDESLVEDAVTDRTRAIVPVHYAGVACEMTSLTAIARRHGLLLVEDAAQGILSTYHGHAVGTLGDLAALSFHETKNVISGEGGALLVNDRRLLARAEVVREKGTNRAEFFRGQIDKYSWVDVGSSYLPSEVTAAFLLAQLEQAERLTQERLRIWTWYDRAFENLADKGLVRRPIVPPHCRHNGHMYYLLATNLAARTLLIETLKARGFHALFHYVPLHSSPAGRVYGRPHGTLDHTQDASDRLFRLPFWIGMDESDVACIADVIAEVLTR